MEDSTTVGAHERWGGARNRVPQNRRCIGPQSSDSDPTRLVVTQLAPLRGGRDRPPNGKVKGMAVSWSRAAASLSPSGPPKYNATVLHGAGGAGQPYRPPPRPIGQRSAMASGYPMQGTASLEALERQAKMRSAGAHVSQQVRRTSAVFKYEVPINASNPPPLEPHPSLHTQPSIHRLPNDPSAAMRLSNERHRRRSSIVGKLAPLSTSPPKSGSHLDNDASAAQDSKPKTQTVNLVFTNQRERRSSSSLAEPMDMYTHPLVKQQQLQLAFNVKMAQAAESGDAALKGLGPTHSINPNMLSSLLTAPLPQQAASRGAPPIGSVARAKAKLPETMISRKTTLSKKYTDVERLVCHSKTSLMMGVKDPKTGRSLVAKCILLLPENTHGEKGRQMALRTAAHMDPHWQEVTPRTVQEVMEEALAMYTLRKCSGAVDLVEVLLEPGNTRVVLVMELLEGGLLSDFMLDHTSGMKEPDVQAAASRLLEVLREAHKAGIAHHDLRPAHVMLTLEGRLDSVKLVDFSKGPGGGVAARPKFDHDVAIATSSQRWYQPPEVAVQESCETSVYAGNMWSFGWMLLAMLTGTEEVFEDPHPPWLVAEPRKLPSGHVQDAWFKMAQRWIDKELKTVLTKLRVHGARKESTDIIQKLLTVDPRERLTAEGALRHPWFQCTYM